MAFMNSFPLLVQNTCLDGDGFYISYNNTDQDIYGTDTTALVDRKVQRFYILNGDHIKEYSSLVPQGLESCLEYFKNHTEVKNKYSDYVFVPECKTEETKCSDQLSLYI